MICSGGITLTGVPDGSAGRTQRFEDAGVEAPAGDGSAPQELESTVFRYLGSPWGHKTQCVCTGLCVPRYYTVYVQVCVYTQDQVCSV